MEYVLRTMDLTKNYGNKTVVDKVNINIAKGDIYGFIGKNGAGKTTTMKMVLGMIFPTSGEIELFGEKANDAARHRIGSLIEAPGLYKDLTAYENLRRFSMLYGGDDKEIKEVLELVDLANTGKKKAGEFSLGMRQRLGIALAMLGKPDLLILDEPVNGLDPSANKRIRDAILRLNRERGVTFFISSHLLGELAKISTRYGIINGGHLVEEVSAKELEERCRQSLSIRCGNPAIAAQTLEQAFSVKPQINGDTVTVYSGFERAAEINEALVRAGAGVFDFHAANSDMEEYFIERIGR